MSGVVASGEKQQVCIENNPDTVNGTGIYMPPRPRKSITGRKSTRPVEVHKPSSHGGNHGTKSKRGLNPDVISKLPHAK